METDVVVLNNFTGILMELFQKPMMLGDRRTPVRPFLISNQRWIIFVHSVMRQIHGFPFPQTIQQNKISKWFLALKKKTAYYYESKNWIAAIQDLASKDFHTHTQFLNRRNDVCCQDEWKWITADIFASRQKRRILKILNECIAYSISPILLNKHYYPYWCWGR